jgi:hypothetical protein
MGIGDGSGSMLSHSELEEKATGFFSNGLLSERLSQSGSWSVSIANRFPLLLGWRDRYNRLRASHFISAIN